MAHVKKSRGWRHAKSSEVHNHHSTTQVLPQEIVVILTELADKLNALTLRSVEMERRMAEMETRIAEMEATQRLLGGWAHTAVQALNKGAA